MRRSQSLVSKGARAIAVSSRRRIAAAPRLSARTVPPYHHRTAARNLLRHAVCERVRAMSARGASSNAGTLDELKRQDRLVRTLQRAAAFPHDVGRVRMLETHISYVLLTGRYAY